jgi:hypothetical protein
MALTDGVRVDLVGASIVWVGHEFRAGLIVVVAVPIDVFAGDGVVFTTTTAEPDEQDDRESLHDATLLQGECTIFRAKV